MTDKIGEGRAVGPTNGDELKLPAPRGEPSSTAMVDARDLAPPGFLAGAWLVLRLRAPAAGDGARRVLGARPPRRKAQQTSRFAFEAIHASTDGHRPPFPAGLRLEDVWCAGGDPLMFSGVAEFDQETAARVANSDPS